MDKATFTNLLRSFHLTDNRFNVSLADTQPPPAWVVGPELSIQEVVNQMVFKRIGAVLVCRGIRLMGIFTERDLLQKGSQGKESDSISQYMTRDPTCMGPRDTVGTALNRMITEGYRHIPILDGSRLPGIVSRTHLLKFLCGFLDSKQETPKESLVSYAS